MSNEPLDQERAEFLEAYKRRHGNGDIVNDDAERAFWREHAERGRSTPHRSQMSVEEKCEYISKHGAEKFRALPY